MIQKSDKKQYKKQYKKQHKRQLKSNYKKPFINDKKPFINSYNNDFKSNYINSYKSIYKSDFKNCYIIQVKKIRSARTATNNKKIKNIFKKFFDDFHKLNVSSYIRV